MEAALGGSSWSGKQGAAVVGVSLGIVMGTWLLLSKSLVIPVLGCAGKAAALDAQMESFLWTARLFPTEK